MSQNSKLKETIDRMVEDAIRRILPSVMNEVLLKTIAGSGVMQERRADRPAYPYVPEGGGRVVVTSKVAPKVKPKARKAGRPDLSYLLDESVGADFYERAVQPEPVQVVEEEPAAPLRERIASNIQTLPPELQEMAEGLELEDDGIGEMWGDENAVAPAGDNAGDLAASSRRVGVDFGRMQKMIQMTEQKKPKKSAEDRQAELQYEQLRLKRNRERLNGGKPVE